MTLKHGNVLLSQMKSFFIMVTFLCDEAADRATGLFEEDLDFSV